MDSLLGALVFVLPGFFMYFWVQAFGATPVVKHSPGEFTAVAALMWLPVSFITLCLYNLSAYLAHHEMIWTVDRLKANSSSFLFLIFFLILSACVSFLLGMLWVYGGTKLVRSITNAVRQLCGVAKLSESTTVWEEIFIKIDDNDLDDAGHKEKEKIMLLQIGKIDQPHTSFITGSMKKVSRPFEIDKAIVLEDVEEWKEILKEYEYPIKHVYIDTKTGLIIKELDRKNYKLKEDIT